MAHLPAVRAAPVVALLLQQVSIVGFVAVPVNRVAQLAVLASLHASLVVTLVAPQVALVTELMDLGILHLGLQFGSSH
eukprot:2256580-Pyramimonas_sp.AAC.1